MLKNFPSDLNGFNAFLFNSDLYECPEFWRISEAYFQNEDFKKISQLTEFYGVTTLKQLINVAIYSNEAIYCHCYDMYFINKNAFNSFLNTKSQTELEIYADYIEAENRPAFYNPKTGQFFTEFTAEEINELLKTIYKNVCDFFDMINTKYEAKIYNNNTVFYNFNFTDCYDFVKSLFNHIKSFDYYEFIKEEKAELLTATTTSNATSRKSRSL